ncbi:MAG: hypothetical protein FWH57_11200 [Oscillospiraceae bacterium]|nr:hypothetical protein [Oscillospiraceae bacterium]
MTITKESIVMTIHKAAKEVLGILDLSDSASLIDKDMRIAPVDFLYIFEILETKYGAGVYDILKTHGFEVMTVENLAEAIYQIVM